MLLSIGDGLRVEMGRCAECLGLLVCMVVHLCVCLYGCETDMSEGYIHVCDLLYFITICTNRGNLHNTRGCKGVGDHPYSQLSDISQITMGLL